MKQRGLAFPPSRKTDKGKIKIGTTRTGGVISIPSEARSAHLHAIGLTRSGKSRFLADLIRQDIASNRGLCLIDPHGDLYELTIDWLTREKLVTAFRSNIHPVDLSDLSTTFCYNPLHIDHPDEAFGVADRVVEAIGRVFLSNNVNETPLTSEVMTMVCVLLAQNRLPLAAARYFLFEKHEEIRQRIIDNASSEWHRDLGDEIRRMAGREYRELISSTRRRFEPFLANAQVERIFSTVDNTASLRQMMDEGHVLLINATPRGDYVGWRVLQAMGIIFTNQIVATAYKRPLRPTPRPFNLYIDEVQNFVSDDIERILSQCAKFGLYLTLSHQYLAQLKNAGEHICQGVVAGTLSKAIFSSTMEEGFLFADEIFSKEIDFNRVKDIETPAVIGHRTRLFDSWADGRTEVFTETKAHVESTAHSAGVGDISTFGTATMSGADSGNDLTVTEAAGGGTSYIEVTISGSSDMEGESISKGTSHVRGSSEGLEPIIEWLKTHPMSLEEQRYELARRIANLPKRQGYFFVRGQGVIGFKSRDIDDPLDLPVARQKLLAKLIGTSPWLLPTKEVRRVIFTLPKQAQKELSDAPEDWLEEIPGEEQD